MFPPILFRSRVFDIGIGAQIEPPIQGEAYGVENRKPVKGIFRRRRIDLLAKYYGDDKGSVSGYGGCPAQRRSCLLRIEYDSNGSKR